jgi:hypothetical protein
VYYGLLLAVGRRLIQWAVGSAPLRGAILVATLLYALLAPRLIIYSYVIAIPAALALLLPAAKHSKVGEVSLLAALCVNGLRILPSGAGKFVGDLVPLLLLWACWLALVALQRTGRLAESS